MNLKPVWERDSNSHKRSSLPRGVSMHINKQNGRDVLVFSSYYKTPEGAVKTRTFFVGREDAVSSEEILHAQHTAIAFRKEYETYLAAGVPEQFNPERYRWWKVRTLYPFQSEETQCDTAHTL